MKETVMYDGEWRSLASQWDEVINYYYFLIEKAKMEKRLALDRLGSQCLEEHGRHEEGKPLGCCRRCGASMEKTL